MKACPYCSHVFEADDAVVCEHCGRNWKTGELPRPPQSTRLIERMLAVFALVVVVIFLVYLLIGLQQVSH